MTIYGDQAVQLHVFNVAALSFFCTVLLLALVIPWLARHQSQYLAGARQKACWVIALAPWMVGIAGFVAAFNFYAGSESAGLFHFYHNHRYELMSWHSIPSVIFIALALSGVARCAFRVVFHSRAISALSIFTEGCERVNEIDIDSTDAFTSGFLKPKVYVSKGLINALSAHEIKAVVEHEKAHQMRLDPLRKLVFSFFAAFFPNSVNRELEKHLHLAMEQCADEYAARRLGDEITVATTLLKVARMFKQSDNSPQYGEYCAFVGNQIRGRMHYLLFPDQHRKPFPYLVTLATLLCVAAGNLFGIDAFHHFTESFFQH